MSLLKLTRRFNESIIIDGVVKITLRCRKGGQFLMEIEAPEDISVHREEIFNRIIREQEASNLLLSQAS